MTNAYSLKNILCCKSRDISNVLVPFMMEKKIAYIKQTLRVCGNDCYKDRKEYILTDENSLFESTKQMCAYEKKT